MAAGIYTSRLLWLKCTKTKNEDNGDLEDAWAANGYLWCSVEETNARRGQNEYDAAQSGVDVEIRVRNYPALSTTDRLEDSYYGYTYVLEGIRNGDDELIVDGFRRDSFTEEEEDSDSGD